MSDQQQGVELLRAFSSQDRIAIALHNRDLVIVHSNNLSGVFDCPPVPPRGRLRDVLMDGDAEETEAFLRQVLDTGAPLLRRDQPVRWQHDQARQRAISLSAFRLEDERGRPTGVVALYIDTTDQWRASRGALAIDNARRYTREHRAAVALQRRLLPPATTDAPAGETAGVYLPAGGGAEIGGDWFDAIALPSLRLALVAGDVVGHGMPASATMGRLRAAIQTLADLELEPDELLTRIADLVQRSEP
ncbi:MULTISPECIES: PP2C family protein-serine/threonine phosphatase [unclassified Streptomyces]|uniref:PP2C family protein-serine/threonine phosphatase n=1 Tax=unclassified Streptomyces TaxID=2593676 RepID=UPI00366006EA